MKPRRYIRLPFDDEGETNSYVDVEEIVAVVEMVDGPTLVHVRGLDRAIATVMDGHTIFEVARQTEVNIP